MKNKFLNLTLKAFLSSFFILSCEKSNDDNNQNNLYEETVAVANRNSSSISFFDANTNVVTSTLKITNSEPMYLVFVPSKDKLYVGDRKNKQVHIINPSTKKLESSINVGNGVFHMWADELGKQLWVNNDIDNAISVIDLATSSVIKTINLDMKPHDVFLTKDGTKAYVSIINSDSTMPDKIYMYSISNYEKLKEVNVGKDPHLFHLPNNNKLIVPCQSGEVYNIDSEKLQIISQKSYPGAHGLYPSPNLDNIFVTNIMGGQIYSVKTTDLTENYAPIATNKPVPHNLVLNKEGSKVFATHSGPNGTTVSAYKVNQNKLVYEQDITVENNPFGLTYYKRNIK
ncbi:YncE family protein [Flavobacterium columnare]|uniref:YncE family protein n=1 Tax=Flavobacterium columnare TaxID=996 RepID=A0A437U9K9_9FLAO|nr:YncE family protein [Flavobacterium columnare]RVU90293.1 YncE family protein [Flavobacterium columnare]